MAPEIPLPRLQRWMQSVVVHPGAVEDAVSSLEAQEEIPVARVSEVILPSRSLKPVERLGIYHGMYLLRMQEALQADFPALEHFLGEDAFRELVRAYVEAFPSRSYSLNPLGDHLPEFVRSAPGVKRPEFCHDLARLELAVSQAFDAPETPPLTEAAIAAVAPEAWETARLKTIEAFSLLAFRYPVNAYLQTVRDDNHEHPRARLKDTWVAIYRRDYRVFRLDLTRAAHDLLADLAQGTPLGTAIAAAIRPGGRHAPTETELFRWFRQWVSGGVFRSVETG
jgi:hypothetical protein